MADWSMGYQTDLQYTYGYFRMNNPLYAKYLFTSQGYAFPDMSGGGVKNACELGFGQGVSITMHAAASDTSWAGNDFNPVQVSHARHFADNAHTTVLLSDDSFEQFANRDDLPEFDFICMHGIWSWISPENQQFVIDFVSKHLKVGGVFYISYNVSPGFIVFEPMRHLMNEINKHMLGSHMNAEQKLATVKDALKQLVAVKPSYANVFPGLEKRIDKTFENDFHYLVGEYLNTYWDVTHHSVICEKLQSAKLEYALSAHATDLMDSLNLTGEQQEYLAQFRGTPLYETCRDLIVNRQFRTDYFVKGARRLGPAAQQREYDNLSVVLVKAMEDFEYSIDSRLGKAELRKDVYEPVLKVLSDHKPHTIGEIKEKVTASTKGKVSIEHITEAVNALVFSGNCEPAICDADTIARNEEKCKSLNISIINDFNDTPLAFLSSPVTQGALSVGKVTLMVLQIYLKHNRPKNHDVMEKDVMEILTSGKNTLNNEGKPVTEPEEQRKIVKNLIKDFYNKQLPLINGLHMI